MSKPNKCFQFMDASKLIAFIILFLICDVHMALINCVQLSETSGTISNSIFASRYSKCWKIIVPPEYSFEFSMESFVSRKDCPYSKVELSIENEDFLHIFCPGQPRNWKDVRAYRNVTITHEMNSFSKSYSKFSMKFQKRKSLLCNPETSFECNLGTCIPRSQVCDGLNQCPNGLDEDKCETGVLAVPGVKDSQSKGLNWLRMKWYDTSSWQENIPRGIIAFAYPTKSIFKRFASIESTWLKQLEVLALTSILRSNIDPLTANQLSMFINAMIASCLDPRNFYGFDLLKLLKEKAKSSSLTSQPVAYLALCNAGEVLPHKAICDLCSILNSDSQYPFFLEVQAVALMALSCARTNWQARSNSSLSCSDYDLAVKKFKQLQLEDGSFGNIYTSAIVTQALLSAGEEKSKDWKLHAVVRHLMRHLNSSSVDFLAVYLILPVLNGESLSDIRNIFCFGGRKQRLKGGPDVKHMLTPKMMVRYSLFIGEQKNTVYTITLQTPQNITVFEIMQLAQKEDFRHKFQWKKMGQIVYIYEIAGVVNDFERDLFWFLYVRKNAISVTHIKESPDKVLVRNGEEIIMWYRKARI